MRVSNTVDAPAGDQIQYGAIKIRAGDYKEGYAFTTSLQANITSSKNLFKKAIESQTYRADN